MSDDYAIVPEKEVRELKDRIESIRKNPLGPYGGQDLIESVNNLTRAINSLMTLFETAAEELKLEERESETIVRKIDPLLARIESISEQNRKIAQGVVAVADMLESAKMENKMDRPSMPPPMPEQNLTPPPSPMSPGMQNIQRPQQMGQRPQMSGQMPLPQQNAIPPMRLPPMPPPRKKGLFG